MEFSGVALAVVVGALISLFLIKRLETKLLKIRDMDNSNRRTMQDSLFGSIKALALEHEQLITITSATANNAAIRANDALERLDLMSEQVFELASLQKIAAAEKTFKQLELTKKKGKRKAALGSKKPKSSKKKA